MIPFHRISLRDKAAYDAVLAEVPGRGCEYAFANLYLWGRQEIAFIHGCVALFSHFYGRSVYPYPIGNGDRKAVIEDILRDAAQRGIPVRITNITPPDMAELEAWFPGKFQLSPSRDSFDYVYTLDTLADLRGKKLQKKRNHVNRFRAEHPNYRVLPLDCKTLGLAAHMVNDWFIRRQKEDPHGDYLLENLAMARAFRDFEKLHMEGIVLMDGDQMLAVTMGSFLSEDTLDVHFEKARDDVDGAYNAVNAEFARYLRLKYPQLRYLNREDDMGLEGLRKAKLSYSPDHLIEKYRAYLTEEIYED